MSTENILAEGRRVKRGNYYRCEMPIGFVNQGTYKYEGMKEGVAYLSVGAELVAISPSFLKYFKRVSANILTKEKETNQQSYRDFLINKTCENGATFSDFKEYIY
ncbi:MAG: hypothetical protein IT292_12580 [Deltaproteobacteria bacterium]|nr:hypothetical protein [Deltaproteobacteria bacterium]